MILFKLNNKEEIHQYARGLERINARKNGYILVYTAKENEEVVTYTSDGNVEARETAKVGDIVATRADRCGLCVIDKFNHTNSWVMSKDTLNEKYQLVGKSPLGKDVYFYEATGATQMFVKTYTDVQIMVPWGENGSLIPLIVKKGGYLNITNKNDIYGIAENEFNETYEIISKGY